VDTALDPGDDFLHPGNEELLNNQHEYSLEANSIVVLFGKYKQTL
jgi:hypothetical protein